MDLLQLQYFCMVAKYESCTRACEQLHVSQPAISNMIARLEGELGVPLFDRKGKRLHLNEYGKCYYKEVQEVLNKLDRACAKVKDMADAPSGALTVWITAGAQLVPKCFSIFAEMYPEVNLKILAISNFFSPDIPDFDMVFWSPPKEYNVHETALILKEPLVLGVPRGHALAQRSSIDLHELQHHPFIFYREAGSIGLTVRDACERVGFRPRVVCEGASVFENLDYIQYGIGVSILPNFVLQDMPHDLITSLEISTPGFPTRDIYLSCNKSKYFTKTMRAFQECAIEFFKQYAE